MDAEFLACSYDGSSHVGLVVRNGFIIRMEADASRFLEALRLAERRLEEFVARGSILVDTPEQEVTADDIRNLCRDIRLESEAHFDGEGKIR